MRDRDVAAEPVRVGAALGEVGGQTVRRDMRRAILGLDHQRFQPEAVDQRRFRMRDRIADHLGIAPSHDANSPRTRRYASTGSNGMPSTVKWAPSTAENNCTPGPSIRKQPT